MTKAEINDGWRPLRATQSDPHAVAIVAESEFPPPTAAPETKNPVLRGRIYPLEIQASPMG
jgi:hypothetical protein